MDWFAILATIAFAAIIFGGPILDWIDRSHWK